MLRPLILFPAYGRTYRNTAEMAADWNAGKDFRIIGGPYCSIRDLNKLTPGTSSITLIDMTMQGAGIEVWNFGSLL